MFLTQKAANIQSASFLLALQALTSFHTLRPAVAELRLYDSAGALVALPQLFTASCYPASRTCSANPAGNAFDGDLGTYWQADLTGSGSAPAFQVCFNQGQGPSFASYSFVTSVIGYGPTGWSLYLCPSATADYGACGRVSNPISGSYPAPQGQTETPRYRVPFF